MKIDGRPPGLVPQSGGARDATPARSGGTHAASGTTEDKVELSPLARTLASLRGEIGDPEAVDEARVAELRARIADGTYDPAPRDVARALLRELAANRRG
jgi:flagellar biosynthesis anti-sigma factor FlgM